MYTKNGRNNNNYNNNNRRNKYNNNNGKYIAHWAFISEHNVLFKIDGEHEKLLNSMNHPTKHGGRRYNCYSFVKMSDSYAQQTNIQN